MEVEFESGNARLHTVVLSGCDNRPGGTILSMICAHCHGGRAYRVHTPLTWPCSKSKVTTHTVVIQRFNPSSVFSGSETNGSSAAGARIELLS